VEPLLDLGPDNVTYPDCDAVFLHGHRRRPSLEEAPRAPGLHLLCRRSFSTTDAMAMAGLRVRPDAAEPDVVPAASVPLTDEDWRPPAEGQVAALTQGRIVRLTEAALSV